MKTLEPVESVAAKIIRAGYRALCLKNHPDHGGSHNMMIALKCGKEWLEGLLAKQPPDADDVSFDDIFRDTFKQKKGKTDFSGFATPKWGASSEEDLGAARRAREWERQREDFKSAEVHVGEVWTTIRGVEAVNTIRGKLCVRVFSKIHWIPLNVIAEDSEVRNVGSFGTLSIKTTYARKYGIVPPKRE